jgi:hypothetical protein
MSTARAFIPRPRRSGLVSQDVDGELLLYVEATHQASSLNTSARSIWALCDGDRTVDAISAQSNQWPDVVMATVRQFGEAGLLENASDVPSVNLSRRRMLGTAALAGPVILMVVAPLATAAASTCVPSGQSCHLGQTCCISGDLCPTPPICP